MTSLNGKKPTRASFDLKNKFCVGIVGSTSKEYPLQAMSLIFDILDKAVPYNPNLVIVTGATDVGINRIVHRWAWQRDLPVYGVACKQAWDFPVWKCDGLKIVGNEWGEESETFINSIQALVQFSETPQSSKEAAMAKEQKKQVLNFTADLNRMMDMWG